MGELTEVLPSPDVHVGVVLAQVVEPALVHHEDPSSDDRRPAERRREVTDVLKIRKLENYFTLLHNE